MGESWQPETAAGCITEAAAWGPGCCACYAYASPTEQAAAGSPTVSAAVLPAPHRHCTPCAATAPLLWPAPRVVPAAVTELHALHATYLHAAAGCCSAPLVLQMPHDRAAACDSAAAVGVVATPRLPAQLPSPTLVPMASALSLAATSRQPGCVATCCCWRLLLLLRGWLL